LRHPPASAASSNHISWISAKWLRQQPLDLQIDYTAGDIEVMEPESIAAEKLEAKRRLDATVTSYTLECGVILHR